MTNDAVNVTNLTVNPDGFRLHVKQLDIPRGYVTGIIGRNGAGKTTLLRSILGLMKRGNGDINILGKTMEKDGLEIKDRIGYVGDNFLFPSGYSAKDIGDKLGLFYSRYDADLYYQLLKRLDVDKNKNAANCSEGTKAKISLAFALATKPELLILDEPTAHLDPVARKQVLDLLYETMQEENNTILFSTHITEDLDRIADYIIHIEDGKLTLQLSKEELMEEYQMVTFEISDETKGIKNSLKGIKKEGNTITALCTESSKYKDNPSYAFKPCTLEEIMIVLNEEFEKKRR